MASITFGGTDGNWSDDSKWIGAAKPSAADDAIFDGSSGSCTIDAGTTICRSIDASAYVAGKTLTHNAGCTLTIGDGTAGAGNKALDFSGGFTYTINNATTSAISFISTSATVQTVNFLDRTTGNVTFNATSNGSWQYTDGHVTGATATVTLTKGTLDINGQTCSWGLFSSSNTNTRTLTLGAAAITITGTGTPWDCGTATNLTINANTSTITLSGASALFAGGQKTYNNVTFTGSGNAAIGNTNTTVANLTRTGTAAKTDAFIINQACTVTGTLTLAGNSATNRLLVRTQTVGTALTITNTGATMTWSNVDFQDITLSSAYDASAITGGSGDCGGNTGITFTTSAAQTWSGTSGGNWSTNAWTSRVPLPQDDVTINAAFSASQTVTADMPRLGRSISWTGATGTPTFAMTSTANYFHGSLTLISGMTLSNNQTVYFDGRNNYTITSAGKSFTGVIRMRGYGGTYSLSDAFVTSSYWALLCGTFTTNNFNINARQFSFNDSGNTTKVINGGTSTWTQTTTTTNEGWQAGSSTNCTMNMSTATVVYSNSSANLRVFTGNSFTYGTLTYILSGSTGELDITGANTFNTINFSDANNARSLKFTKSTTNTIGTFNVNGTSGKLMTLDTVDGAGTFTLTSSNQQSCDYLSITRSTVDASPIWYAGINSTNGGTNTNWIFTAPPTGQILSTNTKYW